MNKTQVKSFVSGSMKQVLNANFEVAIHKWERAKALTNIKDVINWKLTDYNNFETFCEEEFPLLNTGSIHGWVTDFRRMSKYYTMTEITAISKDIGYSRAVNVSRTLQRKISVQSFITRAKTMKTTVRAKANHGQKSNTITLSLDDAHVKKLEAVLAPHGYVTTAAGRRNGISEAMAKLLDTL